MGLTHVRLLVKNPAKPEKIVEGKFLVDSGAFHTVIPSSIVRKLGLQPRSEEIFELADGTTITRKLSHAIINFEGKETITTVVLGEGDDEALFGVLSLETFGFVLDPLKRKLKKIKFRL